MDAVGYSIQTQLILMQARIEDVAARLFSEFDYPIALAEIKNEYPNYLLAYKSRKYWGFKSKVLSTPSKRMFALALFSYLMFEEAATSGYLPDIIGFIADTNYRIGLACECTKESEKKMFGAKKSNEKFEGNKQRAIDFWLKNSGGKGLNFKTKNQAANYMSDNSLVNVSAKTIIDNYLAENKKPIC